MLQSEILDAVYIRIADAITDVPLYLGSDPNTPTTVTEPRMMLYIEPADSQITTLGGPGVKRRFQRGGTIRVVCLTPSAQSADIAGIILAQRVQEIFEGNPCDQPLHYDNVAIRTPRRESANYSTPVVITYRLGVVK